MLGKVGSFFGGIGDKIANSGVGKFVGKAAAGVKNVAGKLNPLKGAGDAVKGPLKSNG